MFWVGKFKFTYLFAESSEWQMSFSTTETPLKRGDMGRGQKVKQKVLSFMDGSIALCSFASFAHPSPYITQIVSKLLESWNLIIVIVTLTLMLIDVQSCEEFGRSNISERFSGNILTLKFYWALCIYTICTSNILILREHGGGYLFHLIKQLIYLFCLCNSES